MVQDFWRPALVGAFVFVLTLGVTSWLQRSQNVSPTSTVAFHEAGIAEQEAVMGGMVEDSEIPNQFFDKTIGSAGSVLFCHRNIASLQ